ncbi:MAG: response regulator [Butyrivibrio sp.]|nr:response regulator [Butyrivibrio sp.]
MGNNMETEKVVIISVKDSFLAKSLITKLDGAGITAVFSHAGIKDIKAFADKMELAVIFLSEEMEEVPETLIYLKDIIEDRGTGLMLIGDEPEYEMVKKIIPEHHITALFKRPLNMDVFVKTVANYIEENTGEKRKKNILIVDDDITYMRTVYGWLKDKYHVGMASNGVQAISYLSKNKADLVLLDYEMPVANGPQVLSMLKSDDQTDQIPVMFLTGHSDRESVMSVLGLRPADYLLKTIDREGLLKKLEAFFA